MPSDVAKERTPAVRSLLSISGLMSRPLLSELLPATERAGLLVTDIEILEGSALCGYAKAWRQRFWLVARRLTARRCAVL